MSIEGIESLDDGRVTFEDSGKMDPVCGVLVAPDKAGTVSVELGGNAYFFCSDECKEVFMENPNSFVVPQS